MVFYGAEAVWRSRRARATIIATCLLTAAWALLTLVDGALRQAGIDSGMWLSATGLIAWPVIVVAVLRRQRLDDAVSRVVVGLGSVVLSIPIWLVSTLVIMTVVFGYR